MIYKGGKELTERYYGKKAVSAVYKGAKLVWEAIRSCFGKGCWIEGKPWVDSDPWRE